MNITPETRYDPSLAQDTQFRDGTSTEIDPTYERIKRRLQSFGNPEKASLEETLKNRFFTTIGADKFSGSSPLEPISPIKTSPYSNFSGRTSHSFQESPSNPLSPRPLSVTTSSSCTDISPIAPLLLILQEEITALNQSLDELTKRLSEEPENFVKLYEKAYQIQKLTSRTQSLKDMAQNLQDSNETGIIIQDCEHILSKLSCYAEKYNYRELALHRARKQLCTNKTPPSDILLPTTNGKQELEQKILLAETFLKISLLSEDEMDKNLLLTQETNRFREKTIQFLSVLKSDTFRLNRIIGTLPLLKLTNNMQDPSKAKDAAHNLIKTLMNERASFPALYRAAIAVASAADELQITQEETAAAFTTIKQLLISIPRKYRRMLADELIRTQAQQPVAAITDLILNPENISQENMPFPLVWSAFSQSADREFSSFQTHFDSYNSSI